MLCRQVCAIFHGMWEWNLWDFLSCISMWSCLSRCICILYFMVTQWCLTMTTRYYISFSLWYFFFYLFISGSSLCTLQNLNPPEITLEGIGNAIVGNYEQEKERSYVLIVYFLWKCQHMLIHVDLLSLHEWVGKEGLAWFRKEVVWHIFSFYRDLLRPFPRYTGFWHEHTKILCCLFVCFRYTLKCDIWESSSML